MRSQWSSNGTAIVRWLLCVSFVTACAGQAPRIEAIHYWGRIIDESTAKPIEFARIRVLPSSFDGAWRSDSRGRFSFWTGYRKNDQLEIEHEGYETAYLSPQGGGLIVVRMEPQKTVMVNRMGLSGSAVAVELMGPSQSIAPAIMTADSGPVPSGNRNSWSRWYTLRLGRAPEAYTVQKVEFWLTGDHACGLSAQCREVERSDDQIVWQFRLRGHDEIGAPPRTDSTAHIRVIYRAQ